MACHGTTIFTLISNKRDDGATDVSGSEGGRGKGADEQEKNGDEAFL